MGAFREGCEHLGFDLPRPQRRRTQGPQAGHQNDDGRDATRGSIRTYHKLGRIQRLIKKAGPTMQYAANVRDNFENFVLKSWRTKPKVGTEGTAREWKIRLDDTELLLQALVTKSK